MCRLSILLSNAKLFKRKYVSLKTYLINLQIAKLVLIMVCEFLKLSEAQQHRTVLENLPQLNRYNTDWSGFHRRGYCNQLPGKGVSRSMAAVSGLSSQRLSCNPIRFTLSTSRTSDLCPTFETRYLSCTPAGTTASLSVPCRYRCGPRRDLPPGSHLHTTHSVVN